MQKTPVRDDERSSSPPKAPTPNPVSISSDHLVQRAPERDGDAEVESQLQQLDLDAMTRTMRKESSSSDASDAVGTSPNAPTRFRKKLYTSLSEAEKWQFADDCAEILMQRVWENPHEQFEAMKRATDNFLIKHKLTLKVKLIPQ